MNRQPKPNSLATTVLSLLIPTTLSVADVIYELDLREPTSPRESGAKLLKEAESLLAPGR